MLSAALFRGNGVTLRTSRVIQGDDNGHVGRPGEVSLARYGASAVARIFRGLNPGFQRNLSQLGGTVLRGSRAVCSVYFCGTVCRSFELMGRTNFTTEFRIPWIVSMVSNLSSAEQREGHNG